MADLLITKPVTIQYPNLAKPRAAKGSERLRYSAKLLFEKEADWAALQDACMELLIDEWGTKAKERVEKGELSWPFTKKNGELFINAASDNQPGIVDRFKDPKTGKPRVIEEIEAEIYSGAIVRAQLRPYTYDRGTKKGVTFNLENIQKWADGERLDGRQKAVDAFDAEDMPEDDGGDMLG